MIARLHRQNRTILTSVSAHHSLLVRYLSHSAAASVHKIEYNCRVDAVKTAQSRPQPSIDGPMVIFIVEYVMLAMRPNCECCDKDLPPQSIEARMCTFECTFCQDCAANVLNGFCPNCGGELLTRPRRPEVALAKHPASSERVLKQGGCNATAL